MDTAGEHSTQCRIADDQHKLLQDLRQKERKKESLDPNPSKGGTDTQESALEETHLTHVWKIQVVCLISLNT